MVSGNCLSLLVERSRLRFNIVSGAELRGEAQFYMREKEIRGVPIYHLLDASMKQLGSRICLRWASSVWSQKATLGRSGVRHRHIPIISRALPFGEACVISRSTGKNYKFSLSSHRVVAVASSTTLIIINA